MVECGNEHGEQINHQVCLRYLEGIVRSVGKFPLEETACEITEVVLSDAVHDEPPVTLCVDFHPRVEGYKDVAEALPALGNLVVCAEQLIAHLEGSNAYAVQVVGRNAENFLSDGRAPVIGHVFVVVLHLVKI